MELQGFYAGVEQERRDLQQLVLANPLVGVDPAYLKLEDFPRPAVFSAWGAMTTRERTTRIGFGLARSADELLEKLRAAGYDPTKLVQDYYGRVQIHLQRVQRLIRTKLVLFVEAGSAGGSGDRGAKSRKGGRKRESNPEEDRKIAEAWGTKEHATYADLGKALGIPKRDVYLALERHRKNSPE